MKHPIGIMRGALATAIALVVAGQATASQQSQTTSSQSGSQAEMSSQEWEQLRQQTVSAQELMDADIVNGDVMDPVGNVRDLVLNDEASAIEYVLYETGGLRSLYRQYGSSEGFATYDNVAIEPTAGYGLDVRFDEPASAQAPERLTLSRKEADHRLLSNILGETVTFSGDESRQVEDVLIDRESGQIKGYVVNANPDAWFNDDPRLIEPGSIRVSEEGRLSASTEFAALERVE